MFCLELLQAFTHPIPSEHPRSGDPVRGGF